jgi:hypothetical protein
MSTVNHQKHKVSLPRTSRSLVLMMAKVDCVHMLPTLLVMMMA